MIVVGGSQSHLLSGDQAGVGVRLLGRGGGGGGGEDHLGLKAEGQLRVLLALGVVTRRQALLVLHEQIRLVLHQQLERETVEGDRERDHSGERERP